MAAAASDGTVLVTGASGYIATHVVQQLQESGYKVRGTVRSKQNEEKVKPLLNLCPSAKHPIELVEADLLKPDGWLEAVRGCSYVMHVASPFPVTLPEDENELIKPAVDGTLNVLQACKEAGGVKKVVLTSSVAAVAAESEPAKGKVFTEEDWTNLDICKNAYYKSKTLAEKAAWDFVKALNEDEKFELATINPSFVMGPVLCGSMATSMEIMKRMLNKEMPMLPKLNYTVVDVRDVAAAHIAAITNDKASGYRHILANKNMWMSDIALILEKEFKSQGYSVPTTNAPYPLMWVLGRFDKSVRMILPSVGVIQQYSNERMKSVLGIQPRPIEDTLIDMAYTLIENGVAKKTKNYRGPQSSSM